MAIVPVEPKRGEIWKSKNEPEKLWYIEYYGRTFVVASQIKIKNGEPERVSEEEVSEHIDKFFESKENTNLSFDPPQYYAWENF